MTEEHLTTIGVSGQLDGDTDSPQERVSTRALRAVLLSVFPCRWAMDFGRNSYSVPDYFGKLRFTYYRTRTESHKTGE